MDKKIDTDRSGPFLFHHNYDREKVRERLIEARMLHFLVREIPILPSIASQIEAELIRKSIFGTAAIEGNPLSEEAVKKLLTAEDKKIATNKAEKQITNLKRAYEELYRISPEDLALAGEDVSHSGYLKLDEKLIKRLHAVITEDSEANNNIPGQYRRFRVYVGNVEHGGVYKPPHDRDVAKLMKEYVEWINSDDVINEGHEIRAALAHYYFALIHPFADGNGRTARIIEAVILHNAGLRFVDTALSNFYYKNLDKYFWAFSLSERNKEKSITPFVELFLNGLVTTLIEIKTNIFSLIRIFTLNGHCDFLYKQNKISRRQCSFVKLLLELNLEKSFTLKDLFNAPFDIIYRGMTERTARRDVAKLLQLGVLKHDAQTNTYAINIFLLG